jgi:hypothetical protein
MNRKHSRLVCVAALLLTLNFAMLPTAEARSLTGSRTAVTSPQKLWSGAIAWLAQLLTGTAGRTLSHASSATGTGGRTGGGYQTQTGPCIDPMGRPLCQPGQ